MFARAVVLLVIASAATPAAGGQWRTYAGGPHRLFFNPARSPITAANVHGLQVKWSFPTGAVVTASPSVATLSVPGEGREKVAFIQSWDHNLYAIRTRDGSLFWRFPMPDQPGAVYPNTASADVRSVGGRMRVFIASGENVYCVDALTGQEVWRFSAGTGCANPPGLCGFDNEKNEVESSPIVAGGKVYFGLDVNDGPGKGGFYAIDARDGRLAWYFDTETGATCRPDAPDDIRLDGYHSEAELGLPVGFLATRPGCNFDRSSRDGQGSVWSSASVDTARQLLFLAPPPRRGS
jgi:outer membrane protein assembly factor BamB